MGGCRLVVGGLWVGGGPTCAGDSVKGARERAPIH
jgi:hypothetical protein